MALSPQKADLPQRIITRLKQLTAKHVFLSSKAFAVMCIGLPLLVILIIGRIFFILFKQNSFRSLDNLQTVGEIGYWLAVAFFLFVVSTAAYLTVTKQWKTFRYWWAMRLARLKDRFSSVTKNLLIARQTFRHMDKDSGILLSMAPANEGLGLEETKVTYEDDRHVTLIGGTRGGKGTSFIIPNLLHHKGSVIVYDPAGENFELTAAYRQQVLGQKVVVLNPFNVGGHASDMWNPLAEIDFIDDPQALDKCYSLAESLIELSGHDPYWSQSAQEMLAMLCAYVGLRAHRSNITLPNLYQQICRADLDPLWIDMGQCEGLGGAVKRYGQGNEARNMKELNSTLQSVKNALRFVATPSMEHHLSGTTFSMQDLKDGNTTVYIIMPPAAGATYKGWLRLLFDSAFTAMQDTSKPTPKHPTLFLMDEFPLLGNMERIKRAAGEAAKFGVKLFLCAQDISQLKEIYGQAWETFIGNSGLTIMFANNDLATQKYLSEKLGQEYYSKSYGSSSSMELRDIARPNQIAHQTHRRAGQAYFLIPEIKPMRLPRATYFDWDMIPAGLIYHPNIDLEAAVAETIIQDAAE